MKNYPLHTSLSFIAQEADNNEKENDAFAAFLRNIRQDQLIDEMVRQLNDEISPLIDCTACGNCCKSLMIRVSIDEVKYLADVLQQPVEEVEKKYFDQGITDQYVINMLPCHFLSDNKCTIYENRFHTCREFPHLHRDKFTGRLFNMFMYYGVCPIIFNVIEQLKIRMSFSVE